MKSIKWQWQHKSGEGELKMTQLLYKKGYHFKLIFYSFWGFQKKSSMISA
jgi:hypothetical protein